MPDFYTAVTSICSVLTSVMMVVFLDPSRSHTAFPTLKQSALLLLNLCGVISCYPVHESCFAVIYFRPVQVLEHQTLQEKMAKMC